MTVLDDVSAFVKKLSPAAVCDDCIANGLGLSVRQHANHKTRELAKLRGYDRRNYVCGMCGAAKEVIRYA